MVVVEPANACKLTMAHSPCGPPSSDHPITNQTAALAEAVAIRPVSGKARKQLILALLDDPGCRLCGQHAEVVLRWRMMAIEPSLNVPVLQPSTQLLQPMILRAALAEDKAASIPVFILSEALLQLVSDAPASMAHQGSSWSKALLHLDLQRLSSSLCMPPPSAVAYTDKPLPNFLYDYESTSTTTQAHQQQQQQEVPNRPDSRSSSSQPCRPASSASAGSAADMPAGAADGAAAIRKRGSHDTLLPSQALTSAAAPRLDRISAPSCMSGGSAELDAALQAAPPVNHISASNAVPQEVANCWGACTDAQQQCDQQHATGSMNLKPTDHLTKQQAGRCMQPAVEHRASSGLNASWASTSASTTFYRQQSNTGVAGGSPTDASLLHPLPNCGSVDGIWGLFGASGDSSGMQYVGSLKSGNLLDAGSFTRGAFMPGDGRTVLLSGLTSNLSGNLNAYPSPGRPASNEHAGSVSSVRPRLPADPSQQTPSSHGSDENEETDSPGGGMDLETALEAIINYESSGPIAEGSQGVVSAATAAAAQQALQQHVAAAVRAASAGMPHTSPTNTGPAPYAPPPTPHAQPNSGHDAGQHMSFAAVTRLASSECQPGNGGFFGSAPTSHAYLQQQSLANRSQQYTAAMGHMDSPSDVMSCMPSNSMGGMGTVSLSAPRPTAGWSHMVSRDSQQLELHNQGMGQTDAAGNPTSLAAASVLATSAPSSNMHGPALMAAAARSMAAAVQQQQQRQHQQAANMASLQQGVHRSMTTNSAVALMAAAKQGNAGMPLMSHQAASSMGMRAQLYQRLTPKMRADLQQLLMHVPGLKVEDLDDNVLLQLATRRNEEEALSALRALTGADMSSMHPMAAYTSHGAEPGMASFATLTRTSSAPLASRALLQKLPPRVFARLEEVVNRCSYMDWKHFDAGVVKVMGQLSEISEPDVLEELQLLEATDLSNVEYMPAYLNKRLNNRLWSRRKAQQAAQSVGHH